MTASGWYPDPSGAPTQRYFDGTRWTEQRAPLPRKKRRTWLWVLLTLFGLAVLVVGGGYGAYKYMAYNVSHSEAAAAGTTVRDGNFEFVVNNVEVAEDWSGDPRPGGEFVVADITVTNIGSDKNLYDAANQKLIDSQGNEYSGDSNAADAMEGLLDQRDVDPGSSIDVKVPFDVPTGTTPDKLVLHDSMFSGGVAVKVS